MDKEGKDNLRRRQLLVLSATSVLGLSGKKKMILRKKAGKIVGQAPSGEREDNRSGDPQCCRTWSTSEWLSHGCYLVGRGSSSKRERTFLSKRGMLCMTEVFVPLAAFLQ